MVQALVVHRVLLVVGGPHVLGGDDLVGGEHILRGGVVVVVEVKGTHCGDCCCCWVCVGPWRERASSSKLAPAKASLGRGLRGRRGRPPEHQLLPLLPRLAFYYNCYIRLYLGPPPPAGRQAIDTYNYSSKTKYVEKQFSAST